MRSGAATSGLLQTERTRPDNHNEEPYMPNKLKTAWAAGQATVNGWLAIPNAFSAEMYSRAGWDSCTVDMQHGVQDYLSCVSCFQGMNGSGAVPMVRVPWNEPGI